MSLDAVFKAVLQTFVSWIFINQISLSDIGLPYLIKKKKSSETIEDNNRIVKFDFAFCFEQCRKLIIYVKIS